MVTVKFQDNATQYDPAPGKVAKLELINMNSEISRDESQLNFTFKYFLQYYYVF